MRACLTALAVNAALTALYGVPALWIARPWRAPRGTRAIDLIRALFLVLALQAVAGLVWNDLVRAAPLGQPLLALVFWIAAGRWWPRRVPAPAATRGGEGLLLAAVLLAALAVRLLHPLRAAYLGQSDAYIHLLFFKDIAASGAIRHPAYPPGYHWVMTLPSLVFRLDPYWMARYGGAWFGVLLCAGTYAVLRAWASATAALLGAFGVACCPLFGILIKTGVGAFANQMGLAFIPVFLLACGRLRAGGGRRAGVEAALLALGLAAAVPLMLIRLGIALGLDALVAAVWRRGRAGAWARLLSVALLFAPAGALTAAHFARAGAFWTRVTGEALTGVRLREESLRHDAARTGRSEVEPPSVWAAGARDLLRVKRRGLAGAPLNAAAGAWLVVLGVMLANGLRRGAAFEALTGWLGVVAGVQTLTGFLEFSHYQRAGWTFLLMTAMAGGVLAAALLRRIRPPGLARAAVAAGAAACLALSVLRPPRHAATTSSAEDELVVLTRELGRAGAAPATLVARSMSGRRARGFWELTDAVAAPGTALRIVNVRGADDLDGLPAAAGRTVFFLDRAVPVEPGRVGAMAALDPEGAARYSAWRADLYGVNTTIRAFLDALPRNRWRLEETRLSPNAVLIDCTPVAGGPPTSAPGGPAAVRAAGS
jgi:hypothetical protein